MLRVKVLRKAKLYSERKTNSYVASESVKKSEAFLRDIFLMLKTLRHSMAML